MKKTLCVQEKFLSVQLFLLDRKLRCISYQAKSAPRGSHCGGTEFVASDPPQAENPALQDFISFKTCSCIIQRMQGNALVDDRRSKVWYINI